MTTNELSFQEQTRYDECRHTISEGLKTCFEVGEAFIEIRDSKLYREEFESFEEFCKATYKIGSRRAEQLMIAAEVKKSVTVSVDPSQVVGNQQKNTNHGSHSGNGSSNPADLITNERQARALANVPVQNRVDVLRKAESTGSVTAKTIIAAQKPTKSEPEELDKEEYPIPAKILPLWKRAEAEAKAAMQLVIKLKSMFKIAADTQDIAYAEIRFQENDKLLSTLYSNLKLIAPFGVCTVCQGKLPEKCTLCKGRGFLSGFAYQMYGSAEIKQIRKKMKALA